MKLLNVSGSPHVHSGESVKRIMWDVNIALIPMLLTAILFFGFDALFVCLVSVVSCILFQWLIEKFLLKTPTSISDGSAIVTGLLLAFNLPSNLPLWIVIIGALVAIGIGKMSFGGLGKNPFNPALVGRVFLLISFPVQMTTWPTAKGICNIFAGSTPDAVTGATPLAAFKEAVKSGATNFDLPSFADAFLGHMGGSLGEISALAIIIGGIYLLCRRVISWHIPVSFIGTAFVFGAILWLVNPQMYMDPVHVILSGGIMLGAVFMATDMVTSPMSKWGQVVFGIGCGLLTIIIRNWGSYPEGVSFAILLMNACVPLINKGFKPKRFAK
ncbi:MAG: RnfABCDGE type electron transport complex subunit D [Bacteroidales bacterium]|nr:RnfABCDGE type electron transport complex subunit D [Bacteroidales bacterium]